MVNLNNKKINYGIAILKMLMCFEVILIHFWVGPVNKILVPFSMMEGLAVPVFMFLSFYFTHNTFLTNDNQIIKKRIWRVVYPQIGWAVLYWSVFIILQIKVSLNITIKDLLWQIVTGHSPQINPSMWFQTILIALTLIYILIFRFVSDKKGILLIIFITILSLWIQYSGYNWMLFGSLRYELKYPLGRLFEMIPYASLGFFVAHFDLFNRLKKNRTLFLIIFGIMSIILFKLRLIVPSYPGFGYSFNNHLLHVFFIVGFAYLLPFEMISEKLKQIIHFITKYTLGVYCIHRLIAFLLKYLLAFLGLQVTDFTFCILIYIIAFYTSFVMCRISSKFFKPLVE